MEAANELRRGDRTWAATGRKHTLRNSAKPPEPDAAP